MVMKMSENNITLIGDFSVEKITLAMRGGDRPGNVYDNYKNGRGVCGIIVAISGGSEYRFSDGRRRMLKAGKIALFSEKSEYVVANVFNEPFYHYTINFSLASGISFPFDEAYLATDDTNSVIDECDKIITSRKQHGYAGTMLAMSNLYSLLYRIFSSPQFEMVDRKAYISVFPAIEYMESNYDSIITTEKLSSLCMMSNTNFRRLFKEQCGVSPIEYLLKIRIARATELITQTSMSISEIAYRCGYKDVEHFCRTYKKRTGITASEVRKKMVLSQIKQ